MKSSFFARALVAALLAGGAASAQAAVTLVTRPADPPVDGSFVDMTEQGPGTAGVYGVELRLGNRTTWEAGVGSATSQSGLFNTNEINWGTTAAPAIQQYLVTWTSSLVSIVINGRTTSYAAPLGTNNTLRIAAKRDATVTVATVDGVAFSSAVSGSLLTGASNELLFFSADDFGGDGFTVTGTARIGTAGGTGAASSEIFFTLGEYTPPVPEPASWALMIGGFGLVGGALRRRRSAFA